MAGRVNFRDEAVRVADLALTTNIVEGCTFDNCLILGPGILFLMGEITLSDCTFTAADVDELVVEAERTTVGAIAFSNGIFRHCTFVRIGFIGPPGMRENFLQNVGGL